MPEMSAPDQQIPKSMGDYLEVMSKSVFQSGVSWKVVESKWLITQEAFRGFDPQAIAGFSKRDLDELTKDTRIIRNRRKIEAIVGNAVKMLELEKRHGSFRGYLRSHGGFEETVNDLRKQFRFLSDMGAFQFLYVVNEEVPSYEEWCASRGVTPQHMA